MSTSIPSAIYFVGRSASNNGLMLTGVAVESRDGNVYCGDCQDFIYDPDLEARRLQKGQSSIPGNCVAGLLNERRQEAKVRRHDDHGGAQVDSEQLHLLAVPRDRSTRPLQHGPNLLHERHPTDIDT